MTTKIMALMLIKISLIGLAIPAGVLQTTTTSNIFAQSGGAQEESEGDLTVVINGETFTTGQTITISGSIDDPGPTPPNIQIVDPEGDIMARAVPTITADDTFSFSFEAGENDLMLLADKPMTVGGNYRVTVTYVAGLTNIDEVNMEFEYIVTAPPEEPSPQPPTTTIPAPSPAPSAPPAAAPPTIPNSQALNITALRSLVAQGQQQFEDLSTIIVQSNVSDSNPNILSNLNSIQLTFQNIREHLNGVAAGTQIIQQYFFFSFSSSVF